MAVSAFGQQIGDMARTPRNIQMGYTATDFWNQWGSVNPRMATFVLVTPQSFWTGQSAIGFTSNTRNMTLPGHPGITFYSTPGLSPSVIEMGLGEPVNLEMLGVYQSGLFTQTDVLAGLWDYAEYEVFVACWSNTDLGELLLDKGNLSDFKDYGTFFNAEGRGLIARLSNEVDQVTQRHCRVKEFRDSTCGHTASTVTISATAYNIEETSIQPDGSYDPSDTSIIVMGFAGNVPPENYYANGKMLFQDGANEGVSREIAYSSADLGGGTIDIQLKRPFPYSMAGTETITLIAGCTRTPEDCKKFSNIENFRGEPFVPGIESSNRVR